MAVIRHEVLTCCVTSLMFFVLSSIGYLFSSIHKFFQLNRNSTYCLKKGGRGFVAGIFIPLGNHYFQALASTLQFVAQVCDRLWLVPATNRAFAYITYMSPPHVALVCSGPPQKRDHLWLNKVASVLGPLKFYIFRFYP